MQMHQYVILRYPEAQEALGAGAVDYNGIRKLLLITRRI